ncbi:MAG: hypothetical protein J6V76_04145 [Bacteroidales bacterium]|nr:hypothetical protein [Bacteroidales bacterium]
MKKIVKFSAFMLAAMFAATSFTSCGDDEATPANSDDNTTEVADLSGIKAVANADGTITIKGTLKANKKIKELVLLPCNPDGTLNSSADKIDLFSKGDEQLKSKGEDGKEFEAPIPETNVPVQIYRLRVKVGTGKKGQDSVTIGRKFELTIGTSKNTEIGSYVSLSTAKVYTLGQITDYVSGSQSATKITDAEAVKTIELVYKDGGKFESATEIGNTVVKNAITQKAAIYSGSKTVMTSTGCIATYSFDENSSSNTAQLTGIIIDSKTVEVDVSKADWTKTKGNK